MSANIPVALVTGGSAGIGASICQHLLDEGYHVLNLSRRKSDSQSDRITDVEVDLSDVEATKNAIAELAEKYEILSLVHNAGVIRPDLIEDVKLEDVEYVTRLHLYTSILLTQGVLEAMKAKKFGRIVLISSRAMLGLATRTGYSATKAAQIGLVRTWAMELGQHGITVNAVAPGPIVTDMFTEVVPEDSDKALEIAQSIPVRRLGKPADVSRAVMFLLSPDNGFITGQCIFVCGGASLGSLAL
ncbi:MAG: SDR family oxidoreductase, partial [Proteobacteria bacterium]|nr:SDR family oxidoreductase [Pseudomonadota bacterium]TDJ32553.1 MAG: SDR family oxidoreductase [Gammaproteobacteria bacterium]